MSFRIHIDTPRTTRRGTGIPWSTIRFLSLPSQGCSPTCLYSSLTRITLRRTIRRGNPRQHHPRRPQSKRHRLLLLILLVRRRTPRRRRFLLFPAPLSTSRLLSWRHTPRPHQPSACHGIQRVTRLSAHMSRPLGDSQRGQLSLQFSDVDSTDSFDVFYAGKVGVVDGTSWVTDEGSHRFD